MLSLHSTEYLLQYCADDIPKQHWISSAVMRISLHNTYGIPSQYWISSKLLIISSTQYWTSSTQLIPIESTAKTFPGWMHVKRSFPFPWPLSNSFFCIGLKFLLRQSCLIIGCLDKCHKNHPFWNRNLVTRLVWCEYFLSKGSSVPRICYWRGTLFYTNPFFWSKAYKILWKRTTLMQLSVIRAKFFWRIDDRINGGLLFLFGIRT